MNRILKTGLWVALLPGAAEIVGAGRTRSQTLETPSATEADRALAEALAKSDRVKAGALLDEEFEWTDALGRTRNRTEALGDLEALASNQAADTGLQSHTYGQLEIRFGFHHGARFSRLWVKREAGWRALVFMDTPAALATGAGAATPARSGTAGDCENPCRTLPYSPKTENDRAVLAEWQKTKIDEWHPDAEDWATHIAEEFLIINSSSERNKAERVAMARKQQAAGAGVPGDPVLSMGLRDFAETVVMISRHAPYRGGKPYYNLRLFVGRQGHWLIAWSQQTTVEQAPPLPPAGG